MSKTYIPPEAKAEHRKRLSLDFTEYCYLTQKLLSSNSQGLAMSTVQMAVGISAKTARRVLALVAVEKDGKFYIKNK